MDNEPVLSITTGELIVVSIVRDTVSDLSSIAVLGERTVKYELSPAIAFRDAVLNIPTASPATITKTSLAFIEPPDGLSVWTDVLPYDATAVNRFHRFSLISYSSD